MTTHLSTLLVVLSLAILSPFLVKAYPLGAPEETCESLRPGHRMVEHNESTPLRPPQSGAPFFSIHVNTTEVMPGDVVEVTIKADEQYFEGYLIQVRDVDEKISDSKYTKYGTFTQLDAEAQPLCNKQAMTHAAHKHFDTVKMLWTAPNTKVENVHFKATVVRNYETFFMNVRSSVLNPTDAGVALVPSLALLILMVVFHTQNLL